MKTFIKTFIYLLVGGFVFLLLILNVRAQELTQDEAKEVELLKAKTDLILDSTEYLDQDNIALVNYSFIDKEVENAKNIIFDNNDDIFSNKEIIGNQYKVYALPTFYKNKDNIVFNIENTNVTKKIWQESNLQTTAEKILSILKTPYVFASSYFPSDTAFIESRSSTYAGGWTTAWNCTGVNGLYNSNQQNVGSWDRTAVNWYFDRLFLNFNTNGISNIATATLYVYSTDNSVAGAYFAISTTTASDPIVVANCSGISKTSITNTINSNDFADNSWLYFVFTGLGTSTINTSGITNVALRNKTYDIDYTQPVGDTNIFVRSSYYAGTDYDPYLLIATSTTSGGGTTTPPVASTTVLTCTPDANLDIGVITSCAFATSGVTYTNYNLPILLYLYIVSLFLACYATFFMFKK